MFYKKLNACKFKILNAALNYFLILSYLFTYNSCKTTEEVFYVSSDSFESESRSDIVKIELKNGTLIDCRNKLIKVEKESDSTVFIVIEFPVSVKSDSNDDVQKINWKQHRIPEKNIMNLHLEKTNTLGILVIIGFVVLVIAGCIIFFDGKWNALQLGI